MDPSARIELPNSLSLANLAKPGSFIWATGIEDTFVADPHARTGRCMDEYELTEHYSRWKEDIELMGSLGVSAARYGIPWYKANPQKGVWDWSFAQRSIDAMLAQGIQPIIDLVHYGTPMWLEGSFGAPDFANWMADYAGEFARQFKDRIRWITPLNEPRITAWYCGRLGWWPPNYKGWRGYFRVLLAASKGIVLADKAIKTAAPEMVCMHVDATDLYETDDSSLERFAETRQSLVFLALDLITGRHSKNSMALKLMTESGVADEELAWFESNHVVPDVIGMNMYPMFTRKKVFAGARGPRMRMVYADGSMVENLSKMYWERYKRPLVISEIASLGSVKRRSRWMDDSVEAVRRTRAAGIPLVGYTWWPMFTLIGWSYRERVGPLAKYVLNMGLWDFDDRLNRIETPLVAQYRSIVEQGVGKVGVLRAVGEGRTHA